MPLSELALEQFSGDKEHGGKGGFWCARELFFFPFSFLGDVWIYPQIVAVLFDFFFGTSTSLSIRFRLL
jgi:hypothetical protein